MTTVVSLRNRVGRMLNDTTLEGYDEGLFYDALNAALEAILPWVPKTSIYEIEGDGSSSYELPDDCYQIEACLDDATGQLLEKAQLIPGHYRGEATQENDWLEYPHGHITFSDTLSVGETITVYYLAHWDKPQDKNQLNDILEPPVYSHHGIALYATAYMLFPSAISASEVRQFNTKVDSGNPEHNPMQQSATYLLKLFTDEMNRHPRHQKAQR
jgi:hypothetical protein